MPSKNRFEDKLPKVPPRNFVGICHRAVELEAYESGQPPLLLYDMGPTRSGQRFSPPGDHSGLYVAVERLTAGAEVIGSVDAWNQSGGKNFVVFQASVKLKKVLDLTDENVLQALGITRDEILSEWEGYQALFGKDPVTWELGRAVFASGLFDGILFPSKKNPTDGRCLLIFSERLVEGASEVVVTRTDGSIRERLPKL